MRVMKFGIGAALALALVGCGDEATPIDAPVSSTSAAKAGTSSGAQINAIRAEAGLPALQRNSLLDRAALAHARDMATNSFMGHTGSDGSKLKTRVNRTGYRWCTLGENVSRGFKSESAAIEGWRVSPGHYRNLVKAKARDYGIAEVNGFHTLVVGARNC